MNSSLARAAALPLLASLSLFAACGGGGDELSAAEYAEQAQGITDVRDNETEALDERFNALGEDDVDGLHDLFQDLADITRQRVEEIDGLKPPADFADEHEAFVEAGFALVDEFDEVTDAMGDAETMDEASAVLGDAADLDRVGNAFEVACAALEAAVADAGSELDLKCE